MIRPASPGDIPSILALERACPSAAHWSDAEYRLVFDPGATPRSLLVADESIVVGFIMVRSLGPEWEIENVAVSPEARGHGIGKALTSAIIQQANVRHTESIFLEVRASNEAARALYTRCGFIETGRRRAYYTDPEEDAVLYRFHVGAKSVLAQ